MLEYEPQTLTPLSTTSSSEDEDIMPQSLPPRDDEELMDEKRRVNYRNKRERWLDM